MERSSAQRVLIAVDSNVLLDLADEVDAVVDVFELIATRVAAAQCVMPPR